MNQDNCKTKKKAVKISTIKNYQYSKNQVTKILNAQFVLIIYLFFFCIQTVNIFLLFVVLFTFKCIVGGYLILKCQSKVVKKKNFKYSTMF